MEALNMGTGDRMKGRVCSRGQFEAWVRRVGLREGKAGDQKEEGVAAPPGSPRG